MKYIKLQDVTLNITDGKHGDCETEENSGFYFISCKDVYDGNINYEDARQITENDYLDTHKRTMLEPNDILVTNSGTIGRMALVKDIPETYKTTFQKSVAIVKPNQEVVRADYLYYCLLNCVGQFVNSSNGSAQRNLLLGTMRKFDILIVEEIEKQKKIASVLKAYDELIENNQKQIKLLEETTQRLYKEWFVDLRFPGYKGVDVFDGVPEGWKICELNNFCYVTDGTHDSPKSIESGIPLVTGKCIKDGYINYDEANLISQTEHEKIKLRSGLSTGDILFSNIGTIGSVCIVNYDREFSVKNVIILKPDSIEKTHYLYYWITSENIQKSFINQTNGSSQQFIGLSFMRNFYITIPTDELLARFNEFVSPMMVKKNILHKQVEKISEARNRLLPKLMNGEIEV